MTVHGITKAMTDREFAKIDANNLIVADIDKLREWFRRELDCSIHCGRVVSDTCVSGRNIVCYSNMCRELRDKNFKFAWFELQDMLDFHNQADYLSVNEIALVDAALQTFLLEYKG